MIEAVLFDMDGLLIDSEPFWQDAELEILGELGVQLTRWDCQQTQGLRIHEVVALWHRRQPWDDGAEGASVDAVAERVQQRVRQLIRERGEPMPGVAHALDLVREQGCRLALASSSSAANISAVLETLALKDTFEVVHSAEHETHGKPHPAVFMHTADALGVPAERCLVVEDSLNGLIAARAARMGCLMVPDPALRGDPRLSLADASLQSLQALDTQLWQRLCAARA